MLQCRHSNQDTWKAILSNHNIFWKVKQKILKFFLQKDQ